jgi:hypothetical protein
VAESGAVQKPVSLMSDDELEARLAQKIALAAESQKNLEYLNQTSEVEIPLANLSSIDLDQAAAMARLAEPPRE